MSFYTSGYCGGFQGGSLQESDCIKDWPEDYVSLQQVEGITDPPLEDHRSWLSDYFDSTVGKSSARSEGQPTSYHTDDPPPDQSPTRSVQKSPYWNAPTKWTVEAANLRAFEVFHSSTWTLSETDLPPEAGLLYMPEKPPYPVLREKNGNEVRSKRFSKSALRDIPWLPDVFDLHTPAWKVNLYMVFGVTVRDMAMRVDPGDDPRKTQQQLENRILKKSLDYRNRYGGFGHDIRPLKGAKVTENARNLLMGNKAGRKPLSAYQLLYGVTWTVHPGSRKMSQSPNSALYPLPKPQELCAQLQDLLQRLGAEIPTMAKWGLFVDDDGSMLGEEDDESDDGIPFENDSGSFLSFHGRSEYSTFDEGHQAGQGLVVENHQSVHGGGHHQLNTAFEADGEDFDDDMEEKYGFKEESTSVNGQFPHMVDDEYFNNAFEPNNVLYGGGFDVKPTIIHEGAGSNVQQNSHASWSDSFSSGIEDPEPDRGLLFEVGMGYDQEHNEVPRPILDPILQEIWDDIMNEDAMDLG